MENPISEIEFTKDVKIKNFPVVCDLALAEAFDSTPYMMTVDEFKSGCFSINNFVNGDDMVVMLPEAKDFPDNNVIYVCEINNESLGFSDSNKLTLKTSGTDTYYGLGIDQLVILFPSRLTKVGISGGSPFNPFPFVVKLKKEKIVADMSITGGTQIIPVAPAFAVINFDTIRREDNDQLLTNDLIGNTITLGHTESFDISSRVTILDNSGGNNDVNIRIRVNGLDIPINIAYVTTRNNKSSSVSIDIPSLNCKNGDVTTVVCQASSSPITITEATFHIETEF